MKKERIEFYEITSRLASEYGEDGCQHCPYREQCEEAELFFGCGVWEEMMGEDL